MEKEETVVDINIADSCAGFAVGAHVRQLVVLAESPPLLVAPIPPVM